MKPEKTLILIKPEAVQRDLTGEIIKRFEQRGFKISGIKLLFPSKQLVGKHYADDLEWKISVGKKTKEGYRKKGVELPETEEEIGNRIRSYLMESLQEKPVIAIVFEGYHAVEIGRKLAGSTEPKSAQPGTIRGDFSVESYEFADSKKRNLRTIIHASESIKEAEREIKLWFKSSEIHEYEKENWKIIFG